MTKKTKPIVRLPKSDRLTEPARKLLEKALTAMVRYPETVDMGELYQHDPHVKSTRKLPAPYCGTVACLAGHVVIASGLKIGPLGDYADTARRALGLAYDGHFFSHKLFSAYNSATGQDYPFSPRAQVRAVVSRVKLWNRTGK